MMKTHLPTVGIHTSDEHSVKLAYTVAFLDAHPLCRAAEIGFVLNNTAADNRWNIAYGMVEESTGFDFFIPAQHLFFAEAPALMPGPHMNAYAYEGQLLYSVESEKKSACRAWLRAMTFGFDVLETIFFHISRYEEVFAAPEQSGTSGRLDEESHLLVQNGLEQQPQVDLLIALLLRVITGKLVKKTTTYDLTHDIDFLYRYPDLYAVIRATGGALYRGEKLSTIRHHWQTYYAVRLGKAKDPYDCFDWLLSSDTGWTEKHLYVMTGGETPFDNHYAVKDPLLLNTLNLARQRGYHLGLHPSYNAGFKEALFQSELTRLREVTGVDIRRSRQHWLRFNWQITPALLGRQGIREDASMGYRKRLGFRCGTGFPYRMYDFANERAFTWREHPLACMDSAAIHQARESGSDLIDLLKVFFTENAVNTHISINFHNSNFDPVLATGRQLADFYRSFVLRLGK